MPKQVLLPVKPAGAQWTLFNADTRYLVGVIGRQFGKSTICAIRFIRRALLTKGIYWWISPTFAQARVVFGRFLLTYRDLIKSHHATFLEVTLINGSRIAFKGSDKPDNLRGETLHGVVLDEAASMRAAVWYEIVSPMLAVHRAPADIIGTPRGKNWFFDLASQRRADPEWTVIHAPSNSSPFFSPEEFEERRRTMPELIFRQEILAEFIDDASGVFRRVQDCISGEMEEPVSGRTYVAGVDLAKHVDFTVISIWDTERKHMVYFDRFNQIDWNLQEQTIIGAVRKYNNARVIIDSTGVGDPVQERLQKSGLTVDAVRFTNQTKVQLVENLVLAIEKREITFPHVPEIMDELAIFALEVGPTGTRRYGA
ncbi:MAG TPA: terminase family protein, partial [Leptospiraceae bacterium]|nr:terminase family protein [Leptospiraceae bacterium]